MAVHDYTDAPVGQPSCRDCYDCAAHVVWQWWAPELWRRFTIILRRLIAARLGVRRSALGDFATVPFGKITECQLRGAVHFHAVIRLDGARTDAEPFPAPTVPLSSEDLAELVQAAASAVVFDAPAVDGADVTRRLRFGAQVDARPIRGGRDDGREVSESAVAGYLAKYVTKATDDLDPAGTARNPHLRRLSATVEQLGLCAWAEDGHDGPYALLGKYDRALGYRGHCATKSRTFSTTMGSLRLARRTFARHAALERRGITIEVGVDLGADDDAAIVEVIGSWRYAGIGWLTEGDAALATMAAASAREYSQQLAATKRQAA